MSNDSTNEVCGILLVLSIAFAGCSALTDIALDQITGGSGKGGINTELVVGDKEQVLGSNIEVKAKTVGKVVGTSDNSVVAPKAEKVEVTNNTIPLAVVGLIIVLAGLVGWLSPRPKWIRRVIQRKPL